MTKTALLTKRFALVWLALGLLAGLVLMTTFGGLRTAQADEHTTGFETVVINPTEVDLEPKKRSSKTVVWIYGGGFVPGTEVSILVEDGNGVLSDITSATGTFPLVANDEGAFATRWQLGRFTRKGVGGEGMQTLWVVDQLFNNLATTPIAFCNLKKRAEDADVPSWCSS